MHVTLKSAVERLLKVIPHRSLTLILVFVTKSPVEMLAGPSLNFSMQGIKAPSWVLCFSDGQLSRGCRDFAMLLAPTFLS